MEPNFNVENTRYKFFFLEDKTNKSNASTQSFVMHKIEGELNDNFRFVGFKLTCGIAYFEDYGYSLKNQLSHTGGPGRHSYDVPKKRRCPICFPEA